MTTSERRLSDCALHFKAPDGIVSSDFPRLNRIARKAGIHYDLWQQGLLYLLFARDQHGRYVCGEGGLTLSSCRQIGKTFTLGSGMAIKCIMQPGLTVIWTAHHSRTSDQTFNDLADLVDARGSVFKPYVDRIRRANGQQEIRFKNGSLIAFGAREHGFGRGLHSADVEVFDEAQILTVKALDNLVPVMNTAQDPLVVFLGNPPKPGDPSEVFQDKRTAALSGMKGMAYIELSAEPGCDLDDREQWARANPSYPKRTSEQSIIRLRKTLAEDSFRREALGVWDENTAETAISADDWEKGAVTDPDMTGRVSYGVDMPPDRSSLAIGVAIRHDNGETALVNMQEYADVRTRGTAWAVDYLADKWKKASAIVIDSMSPAVSLVPDLEKRHVRVTVTQTRDLAAATGRMLDMIHEGTLQHLPAGQQPQLTAAALGATLRAIGPNGAMAWNKKGSDIDISPLQAATLALHGAYTSKRDPRRKQRMRRLI